MSNSVYEARWLLGSVLFLSFGVFAIGMIA